MSNKKLFTYTKEQKHLHDCESRIRGLTTSINMGMPYHAELKRMQFARKELLTHISESDLMEMEEYESRVMTPREREEEVLAMAKAMAENRDRPSI